MSASTQRRTTRRSFLLAAGLGALLATVLFGVVMQSGRDGLLDHDLLGNFYDGQARALLDGHIAVDPDVPGIEGFRIGDRTYIYQGITPALARMPLLAVTDRFDGRLTGVSMFLAFVVAMGYVVAAGWRTRWLIRGPSSLGRLEWACTAVAAFGIGAGSLLFLGAKVWVYHEALLWGAALCLASFTHLLYWLTPTARPAADAIAGAGVRPSRHHGWQLVAAVVLGGLAVNTRSSIGLGPLAALGLTSLVLLLAAFPATRHEGSGALAAIGRWSRSLSGWDPRRTTSRPLGAFALIVVGVLAAVVVYAGVNQARFGSLFGVPLDRQVLVATDAARREALAANDNSLFGIQYVPSVVAQIVRPDALGLHSQFPFVTFPDHRPAVIGDAVFAELDWSSSVPSSEPLLFLGALFGVVVLIAPRRLLRGVQGVARPALDRADGIDATPAPDPAAVWSAESGAAGEPPAASPAVGATEAVPLVAATRLPVIGAAVGAAVIVVFGYIAQRYLSDLYPLLVLGALVGLHTLAGRLAARDEPRSRWPVALVAVVVVVTSLWTAWANTALALQYDREISPGLTEARRVAWLRTQLRFGADIDVRHLPSSPTGRLPLPEPERVGQIAVVGDCEAVYRSNGTTWYLLESGVAAGGIDLAVTRTGALPPSAILASSSLQAAAGGEVSSADLVLESLGGDDVRLVVVIERDGETVRSLVGRTFQLADGATLDLAVSMDWRTGNVVVTDTGAGEELLRVQIGLPDAPVTAVGEGTVQVVASAPATPLCDELTD